MSDKTAVLFSDMAMKALYIFSGKRSGKFTGTASVDYPDTQLYGMNHLVAYGIEAESKELESSWLGALLARLIGFRAKHFLMYFVARRYDVVFGISVLYMLAWKKFIPTKAKFIIFNSVLNRMFLVHKEGSLKRRLLLSLLREADGVIFFNQSDKAAVVSHAPFLAERSFVVPMGVDTHYHKPTHDGREGFYLSVGRDNGRDYRTVIEAAKKLTHEKFVIVCLPRNVAGLEIPPNVTIRHDIPRTELQSLYARARALLLILHDASNSEGTQSSGPTVLLEAMAIGIPIIVSRKEYVREYGDDGTDMLMVDFYDADAIVHCIARLSDSALRSSLARSARAKAEARFSTVQMAKSLADVFKTVYGT